MAVGRARHQVLVVGGLGGEGAVPPTSLRVCYQRGHCGTVAADEMDMREEQTTQTVEAIAAGDFVVVALGRHGKPRGPVPDVGSGCEAIWDRDVR